MFKVEDIISGRKFHRPRTSDTTGIMHYSRPFTSFGIEQTSLSQRQEAPYRYPKTALSTICEVPRNSAVESRVITTVSLVQSTARGVHIRCIKHGPLPIPVSIISL